MASKDEHPAGSARQPARAKRPRDFGAPEPKPSRKVALDEVLRTLQDLVGNELNVETPAPAKSSSPRRRNVPEPPPEVPEEIILAVEADPVTDTAHEALSPQEPITEIEITAPEEPPAPARAIPPGGLQQELPHLDPDKSPPSPPVAESVKPAPDARDPDQEPIDTELPELERIAEPLAEPAPAATLEPETDHDNTPSDIPVLEDIVDETEEVAIPVDEPGAALAGLGPLPQAADARKLAIQVAARLNVDLRKAGKPVLASDVIARLARTLEEALAKAGTKRDNDTSI